MIPRAILIGWIVNHGRGSLVIAILAHFGSNCVNSYVPLGKKGWLLYFGLLWSAALVPTWRKRPRKWGWPGPTHGTNLEDIHGLE